VFVALAFEVAKKGLAWYVSTLGTFSVVYGALATLPILLLWIYMGWVIMLLGAVIAAYAPSLQMRVSSRERTPGWRFELALTVLTHLWQARQTPQRGLSMAALSETLRVDPLQLEPVMELLTQIDWVSKLDEDPNGPAASEQPRYVMLCDPQSTLLSPLLSRTLLQPGEATTAFRAAVAWDRLTLQQALVA
jgi:membrane protein